MFLMPDEHKLAIYMPFFIPIGIPLLKAVFLEFTAYRRRLSAIKVAKTE